MAVSFVIPLLLSSSFFLYLVIKLAIFFQKDNKNQSILSNLIRWLITSEFEVPLQKYSR